MSIWEEEKGGVELQVCVSDGRIKRRAKKEGKSEEQKKNEPTGDWEERKREEYTKKNIYIIPREWHSCRGKSRGRGRGRGRERGRGRGRGKGGGELSG